MIQFFQSGWQVFDRDAALKGWLRHAVPEAIAAVADPAKADWRCGGTWFAGVNALENDGDGAIGGSGPLRGAAVDFIAQSLGQHPGWDRGQISVIRPGYPQPGPAEPPTAYAFRRDRDAAHVDGLLPVGPDKRRMLREPHGFVLGLPMSDCSEAASPLVVWEGSHAIIRAAFAKVLASHPPETWPDIDLTDTYHTARRRCFAECRRVSVYARPGAAYVVHRMALHGVSPWGQGAEAPPEGRVICYFRPEIQGAPGAWLTDP